MGFTLRGAGVALLLVGLSRPTFAEPTIKLADVIAVAVRQSPELERARLDVETAKAQLLQAEGIQDARIGASASVDVTRPPSTDPNGPTNNVTAQASLTKPLSTGGTLGVVVSGSYQYGLGTRIDPNNPKGFVSDRFGRYAAIAGLEFLQPLLRGRGSDAFEAPIRQVAQARDAAALTREARARDLVVQIAQSYWQVALSWRQLEVRKASLELAQRQLTYTEGAIRAEKLSRSDLLAVQAAIATRKQDILAGEQDIYERSLALRQLGGLEIGPDSLTVPTEALPDAPEALQLDVAAVVRQAYEHSAELAALIASRKAAETAVAIADNAARSQLDLDVTVGPQVATQKLADTGDALKDPGIEVTGQLTYNKTISARAQRGAQAVARAALQTAKVAERDAQARLAVRATRAVQRAQAALATIALATEAISLAEQNVTAEQSRFTLGKSTNFEVLRRQDELEQARLRHASAIADYLSARADLDGLSGAILPRYSIVMP